MANKNLSQLPTNATPQETDWLLGASGASPAVFQKIPVGAIQPTGGSGGSIKFSLPVNENKVLTTSGYYFTDNIAGNIGVDCSQLGIGDHISWFNLSTKSVVFYGLATVNGALIPANQGIKIASGGAIDFFLKDASFNAMVLSGIYTIYWIPGQEPPGYKYWEISYNGNLSELQYEQDGFKYTFSASNYWSLSAQANVTAATPYLTSLSDGVLSTSNDQYIGSSSSQSFCVIRATNSASAGVLFNKIWLYPQAGYSQVVYNLPGQIKFRRSFDNINWENWVSVNISSTGNYVGSTNLTAQGFTASVLKSFILPY